MNCLPRGYVKAYSMAKNAVVLIAGSKLVVCLEQSGAMCGKVRAPGAARLMHLLVEL